MPCCIMAERLLRCDSSVGGNEGDNSEVEGIPLRDPSNLCPLNEAFITDINIHIALFGA